MSSGTIGYRYAEIEDETDNMIQVNREIEGLIEGLGKGIGQALDGWDGEAATSYNEKAGEIAAQLNAMNTIVNEVAVLLKELAREMEAQDGRSGGKIAYA